MSNAEDVPAYASPLKTAFAESRANRDIVEVLPVLLAADLFVVCGTEVAPGQAPDYFLTPSPPKNGRMCVTVSERVETLSTISWPKVAITGERLLRELPKAWEVVVVYPDGGDYLPSEHLAWYRDLLSDD
jgi:hypothetical protein